MILAYFIVLLSFGALIYSYLLYPLILGMLSPLKQPEEIIFSYENLPEISILIAAHNEELLIREKLESIFNSHYPPEKVEVFVGSDASTDRTDEIINTLSKEYPNLHLIRFPGRTGKIDIINKLVELSTHSILVITDANVVFEKEALAELLKNFANSQIALADTHMMQKTNRTANNLPGEGFYLGREVNTKYKEGILWGTMMGPFGGCYAVRKDYYCPVPGNFLVDDFYINMKVLEKGGKAISQIKAIVYEDVTQGLRVEFKRKIRIATGSFQNLFAFSHLLLRPNAISFCFLSHKVIRWFGPVLLLFIFCASFIISYQNPFCHYFFETQIILLSFIPVDYILNKLGVQVRALRIFRYFFITNLAVFIGMLRAIRGVSSSVWEPTQRK